MVEFHRQDVRGRISAWSGAPVHSAVVENKEASALKVQDQPGRSRQVKKPCSRDIPEPHSALLKRLAQTEQKEVAMQQKALGSEKEPVHDISSGKSTEQGISPWKGHLMRARETPSSTSSSSPAILSPQLITTLAHVHRVTAGTPTHQATTLEQSGLFYDFSQKNLIVNPHSLWITAPSAALWYPAEKQQQAGRCINI